MSLSIRGGTYWALAVAALAASACSRSRNKAPDPAASTVPATASSARPRGTRAERVAKASTTQEMLNALSKDCLSCAETSGCLDPSQHGGLCETVSGQAKGGGSEAALCLDTLRCVFTSKCANTGEQSACLCGKTDIIDCMEGKAPPDGTCVAVYKNDFGSDGNTMYDQFLNHNFGAGRANAIIQCVIPMCPSCRIP